MKKLYIRYFHDKESNVPDNSDFVIETEDRHTVIMLAIERHAFNVMNWMFKYPNGKVDFVCL